MNQQSEKKLNSFKQHCEKNRYFNIGYPEDADFDLSELKDFLNFSLNNCGDHERYCNYALNTMSFETEVISHFIKLFKGTIQDIYGYITHGGTEGNLWGLYIARNCFPDGIVYLSKDSHYSAVKNIKLLNMPFVAIDTDAFGEMNYLDLSHKINPNKSAIVFATIGSTTRGAIDNVKIIRDVLEKRGVKNIYMHADEALSGAILPFVDDPQPHTFSDGIDSLTVCITKGYGSPMPCAVALAKRAHLSSIQNHIDYIQSHDVTISGSRNGLTPLIAWYQLQTFTNNVMRARVQYKITLAQYLIDCFQKEGINAWRHRNSITVVAPKPSDALIRKFKLAPFDNYIHIIATAHNTNASMDALVKALLIDYSQQQQFRAFLVSSDRSASASGRAA